MTDYWWSLSLVGEFFSKPPIEPVIWTLRVELVFYIICAVITAVSSLKNSATIAKLAIVLTIINLLFAYLNNTYMLSHESYELITHLTRCVSSLLLMFVGTCFYNLFKRDWSLQRCLSVGSLCIILSLGVLASHRAYDELGIPFGASYIVATLIFVVAFSVRDVLRQNQVTNFIANISYPLYLTHCAAGGALLICFQKFFHNAYISLFATGFILIAASYLLHIGVELPSNEFGKRMAKRIN
jgi:peptidoglycan/LPS O-acetylase OafA/YrhL